jgi:hypothetical protein
LITEFCWLPVVAQEEERAGAVVLEAEPAVAAALRVAEAA